MNLPIYEQTRRLVPCALLFDEHLTLADHAEHLEDSIELEQLPTAAELAALAAATAGEPIVAVRPGEGPAVWWAILSMAGLAATLAVILWLSAGGAA